MSLKRTNTDILSQPIDIEKLQEVSKKVSINSEIITELTRSLVAEYLKPLDEVMQICREMFDTTNPLTATNQELEDLVLRLPTVLYFVSTKVEEIGVQEDTTNATRKEVYNTHFSLADGTIADKQAQADLASQYEYVEQIIKQRAYKMIRARIDAGYEMLKSIKKVMTRRELEMGMPEDGVRSY